MLTLLGAGGIGPQQNYGCIPLCVRENMCGGLPCTECLPSGCC